MLGSQVEETLIGITKVYHASQNAATSLSGQLADGIVVAYISNSTNSAYQSVSGLCNEIQALGSKNSIPITQFNNTYGSPWTEIKNMQDAVAKAVGADGVLTMNAEKSTMLTLLQNVTSTAMDAKHALLQYHDYLQRGMNNNRGQAASSALESSDEDEEDPTPF